MSMKLPFTDTDLVDMYNAAHSKEMDDALAYFHSNSAEWTGIVGELIKTTMGSVSLQNEARLLEDARSFRISIPYSRFLGDRFNIRIRELLITKFMRGFNAANSPTAIVEKHKMGDDINVLWRLTQ